MVDCAIGVRVVTGISMVIYVKWVVMGYFVEYETVQSPATSDAIVPKFRCQEKRKFSNGTLYCTPSTKRYECGTTDPIV